MDVTGSPITGSHGTGKQVRATTTTEAAVLALLAINGEQSGYDLLKHVGRSIGHVWAPAKSQLYALLPRLVRDGLASSRTVVQSGRPDKELYALTAAGRAALDDWLTTVVPNDEKAFVLKLFVGGLTTHDVLRRHLEQFRDDSLARLAELEEVDRGNTREGNDWYHGLLLDLGLARARGSVAWAEEVLKEL
ncbi:MAG TPA: PadR family transcriptional regulator [Gaiellaceae bacterium]|nr:PadR family transcriptional regulator [Gaiellaceae bacterium]